MTAAAAFAPVRTTADLDALDAEQVVAGYRSFAPGDPEPGPNSSRAYWHGWRDAARDQGCLPGDAAMAQLAGEVLLRSRMRARRGG